MRTALKEDVCHLKILCIDCTSQVEVSLNIPQLAQAYRTVEEDGELTDGLRSLLNIESIAMRRHAHWLPPSRGLAYGLGTDAPHGAGLPGAASSP